MKQTPTSWIGGKFKGELLLALGMIEIHVILGVILEDC